MMITPEPPADRFHAPSAAIGAGALTGRLLSTEALSPAEREAWHELADRAAEPNPFFRPEFVLAAVEGRGEHAVLLIVDDGETWSACLPLRAARRWRRLRLPCLVPWLPDYAYLATPLVDRDRIDSATTTLAGFVDGQRRWALLVLDPLDRCGPVGAALTDALAARGRSALVYSDFQRAALQRRPRATYLEEALSGRRRKELRRLRRTLGEEAAGDVVTVDRSTDPTAVDAFLELEDAGWKGELGTALASRHGDAEFFRQMCAAMGARGGLQILALEAGGRTIAMQCNLLERDVLFGFKVAYDRDWARFSPGVLLEVDAIEVFHDRLTARLFDSCAAPDNELLNRLWPDRRRLETTLLPTGAPAATLLRPALRVEAGARRLLRRDAGRAPRRERRP